MGRDFYEELGVSESASADEIKKSFRKLAKQYHPDRNPGDSVAEAKFKAVSEAYNTLSDAKKKAEYDNLRKYGAFSGMHHAGGQGADFSQFFSQGGGAGRGGFQSFGMGGMNGVEGLDDILSQFFGGGMGGRRGGPFSRRQRQRHPERGRDIEAAVRVSFMESARGTRKTLRGSQTGKTLAVTIPAGVENGGKIRLTGQGGPGQLGGPNGDLIITVQVMADQNFERKGNDVYTNVKVSFKDAILGCKAEVKTLTKTINLSVPAGTQPGALMRLKGMGLAVGGKQGDQYVRIEVELPMSLTDAQRELLEKWE